LYLADLQKTYENLTMNLGEILQKSYKVLKIRRLCWIVSYSLMMCTDICVKFIIEGGSKRTL